MQKGTLLGDIMGRIRLDHEDPKVSCWTQSVRSGTSLTYAREILYFNLFHPTSQHHELRHIDRVHGYNNCVNPWHMHKGPYISQGWLYPYDHPHITNRWALLLWYLKGNKDHRTVSLEDAIQLFQEEGGFEREVHSS